MAIWVTKWLSTERRLGSRRSQGDRGGRRALLIDTAPGEREPGARPARDALRAKPLRLPARRGAAMAVEGPKRVSGLTPTSGRRGAPSRRGPRPARRPPGSVLEPSGLYARA